MGPSTIKHVAVIHWDDPTQVGWALAAFFLMEEIRIRESPGEDGTAPLSTLLGSQVNEIAALLTRLTDAEVPGPGRRKRLELEWGQNFFVSDFKMEIRIPKIKTMG